MTHSPDGANEVLRDVVRKLEAQCASMRELLETAIRQGISREWGLLAEAAISSDAGAQLLERLEKAEKIYIPFHVREGYESWPDWVEKTELYLEQSQKRICDSDAQLWSMTNGRDAYKAALERCEERLAGLRASAGLVRSHIEASEQDELDTGWMLERLADTVARDPKPITIPAGIRLTEEQRVALRPTASVFELAPSAEPPKDQCSHGRSLAVMCPRCCSEPAAPPPAPSPREPHRWSLNVTCPKCGHTAEAEDSFPCCEHVAELRAQIRGLEQIAARRPALNDEPTLADKFVKAINTASAVDNLRAQLEQAKNETQNKVREAVLAADASHSAAFLSEVEARRAAEATVGSMRSALESLRKAEQYNALVEDALSTDSGKGWLSPYGAQLLGEQIKSLIERVHRKEAA